MTRREFIIDVFKHSQVWTKADWVFSLFTIVADNNVDQITEPYDYQISVSSGKYVYYLNNTWNVFLDNPSTDRPLVLPEEGIQLNNQSELIQKVESFPLQTSLGTFFVNHYCLVYPFGDKIPYQNGKLSIGGFEKLISPLVKDDNDKDIKPTDVTVDEAKKFMNACSAIAGFSNISTPSATKYTMQPAPGIENLRRELIEKYKDKLHDPAIVALIEKQLVEYDKAFQTQDPEGGFYINDKAFNVSRKKLFVMNGLEQSELSGGEKTFIETSLSEGWDVSKLPAMIDSLRDGSYNRGAMTALGGEAVKFIFRIFAATRISEEDCGSTIGILTPLTKNNINQYIGNTIILPNKQQVKLDKTNMMTYVGQTLPLRSPGTCKTAHSNFCLTCLGEQLRNNEGSLAALASEVGSKMLGIFMKKMHGVALTTTPWDWNNTIK